ncbi:MAG: DNA-binding LytR/AlgR family response regulator [Cyclobacteriaceae bacterium]|jgi:DNA-binding LytR/AlgR family response regulator
MKYIIIEDEQLASKRLREMIESIRPDYNFLTKLDSVESAVIALPALKYDLLFMDIQLADGISFDIFDQITVNAPIIFTTAYDEYAVKAFKSNSVDYLLKPIDQGELRSAIEKFENTFHRKPESKTLEQNSDLNALIRSLQPKGKERFVVRVGEHLKTIQTADVQLIYSQDKATYIFTKEGRRFLIDFSLDQLEELLSADLFFKLSRKFMINLSYIKDIVTFTNSRLEIIVDHYEEEQIIVARERVKEFRTWLDR